MKPLAGGIYNGIRTWCSGLIDVTCFPHLQFCAMKMTKSGDGQPQRAMMATFGHDQNRVLYCVVVGAPTSAAFKTTAPVLELTDVTG